MDDFRVKISPDFSLTYYFRNPYNIFNWGINFSIGYDYVYSRLSGHSSSDVYEAKSLGYLYFTLKLAFKIKSFILNLGPITKFKIHGFDYYKSPYTSSIFLSNKTIFGISFDVGFLFEKENLKHAFLLSFSGDLLFKSIPKINSVTENGFQFFMGIKLGFTLNLM